ncbi:MAG: type II toxin-antitoxin system RelE family toxin [Burkholderiales bacterium]
MAEYRLFIKPSAAKEIEAIGTKTDRHRIVARIRALAEDPRSKGAEKLAGHEDRYRVRQGRYRIVYLIEDERREITVYKVGHRKDVYR